MQQEEKLPKKLSKKINIRFKISFFLILNGRVKTIRPFFTPKVCTLRTFVVILQNNKFLMVHIISEKNIHDFAKNHPQHRISIEAWLSIVKKDTWNTPQDIVNRFKSTENIGNDRVIINIKGNHIRIIAKYQIHSKLKKTKLYIKWIGSHAEYDKLNKQGLQHTVDMFK